MKKIPLLFFIFLTINCFAQLSKTHYIPPLTSNPGVLPQDHYIYISTPSVSNVKFKIMPIGGSIISGIVSKSKPFRYDIGSGENTQLFEPRLTTGLLVNKGFIIESESLIYANIRTNSGNFNQASGLVAKGNSALGKRFRAGAMLNTSNITGLLNFFSVLATENNTEIKISNIPNGTLLANGIVYNNPFPTIKLSKNESYILAINDNLGSNIIGALIESNKDVVVNSGSFGGTNDPTNISSAGRDIGFDQIVGADKIGTEYIFIKGKGTNVLERILIIADEDNTEIYANGSTTPITTIQTGKNYIFDGSAFVNNNLYIKTSKKVFAYQSIGGTTFNANQNLFFVPPINCSTPKIVDNIPQINLIGNRNYDGVVNIVTETGATVLINEIPTGVPPIPISGNPNFVFYSVNSLTGDVAIKSTKQVYVSYYGTNIAATYGGYYSGFDIKPELSIDNATSVLGSCIPNIKLKTEPDVDYTYQWIKNGLDIAGETGNLFTPLEPGSYQVNRSIPSCNTSNLSDKIPVSICPTDNDNDSVPDDVDLDLDNDGITNCSESFGNWTLDLTSSTISKQTYSNSFSTSIIPISLNSASVSNPLIVNNNGDFISEVPSGKGNNVTYKINFTNPISLVLEYVNTANFTDLINSDGEFIVKSDTDKTVTVLNPNNQLLIDTNYDGVFESGITQYSSFEIRFRLNNTAPLTAGTGTFKFQSYLTNSLTFIHSNLSETSNNKATFNIKATCVPKDSDLDLTPDYLDTDSDNDGIVDLIESQPNTPIAMSTVDINKDGIYDVFGTGTIPKDTDLDTVDDYIDEDTDNDGVLDNIETGNDQDNDGIGNYRDLDRENDGCYDVVESGFSDGDSDGKFGITPITIEQNGRVFGAPYSLPNSNYSTAAPITITTQPIVIPTCELQNTSISVVDNGGNTYQWQLSTDGISWYNITNNITYSGVTTNTLSINLVSNSMNGYEYRVQLSKAGNSCDLISAKTTLSVYPLPIVNDVTIIQCDSDTNPDGKTFFNLTVNNNLISANYTNENFTFYTSQTGATNGISTDLIANNLAFENTNPSLMYVWVRIANKITGCFSVAKLTLKVPATNLLPTYKITVPAVCDDFLDTNGNNNSNNNNRDGIAGFDFSWTKAIILSQLPTNQVYVINYYRNKADALAENNFITDISNYRNIGYPNSQDIWVRVESKLDNACVGLGPYITLKVEALPFANSVIVNRQCDDNHDGIFNFNTSNLEATILNGQTDVRVTYLDQNNSPLKDVNGITITSPFPSTFRTKSQIIKAVVTNNSVLSCFDETLITFTIDDLPEAFPIPANLTSACDDEIDPLSQDGKIAFDTSSFQSTIIGTQTAMTVTYTDAIGNTLSSPLPNPFITGNQTVTATVINPLNTSCIATTIINFVVNPIPKINLNNNGDEDELVCSNIPTFYVSLNAGIQDGSPTNNYTYIWSKDDIILPSETNYNLNVNSNGDYLVKVTSSAGCYRTRSINVTASDIATIDSVVIIDLTDQNSVTINVSGKGIYEYSLDAPIGPFQESNFFENVTSGIHDIYINDKNGCGIITKTIAVIGIPRFFTPNGDGFNDFWNIKGVNNLFNSKSIIYIFDRYGKLIKQVLPSSQGWDGTINGSTMPADDYWFTVKLEDGREVKGHFSLKR